MLERFLDLQHNKHELKIRYLESGNNDNAERRQYVLFIHGLGSSADRWLDIPDALSLYFHTLAIDLPGFGGSDKPSDMDYTIKAFSDIVRQFMEKIRITAAYNSNFLDKLVLVDSSGNLEKPTPLLDQYLDAAMNPSKEKVRKVFEQMVANPLLISDVFVQGFIDRINSPGSKYAFESSLRNSANTQIGIKNLNKIGEKGIPTLIIWGMYDKVIPTHHSQIFREAIKGSAVNIIPSTGHAPFTEKPALVCEHLHKFLSCE